MTQSTGSDRHGSPLHNEHDSNFFPSLPSKRRGSLSDEAPSFRLYHGVPFVWESKPGKPKKAGGADASSSLPPLTPPPRYYCAENKYITRSRNKKNSSRFKRMVEMILRVFTPATIRRPLLPASPSKLQLSSLSSWSSPPFSRPGSSRSSMSSSMSFTGEGDDSEVRRVPCMFFYCGRG